MVVMAIRQHHTKLVPSNDKRLPETARELFDALPELPGFRADVVEGNLIVSPVGTPEHADCAMELYRVLLPVMQEHGWKGRAGNVDVCVEGPREPVEPDFVLAPPDCPRGGDRELRSSGLIMVAEVVSAGSALRDRVEKPPLYATGGVPIYLLIDLLAEPPSVTAYSEPRDGAYLASGTVPVGSPLRLPSPIDVELDTSVFKV